MLPASAAAKRVLPPHFFSVYFNSSVSINDFSHRLSYLQEYIVKTVSGKPALSKSLLTVHKIHHDIALYPFIDID
jgi:hypothetical protein